MAEKNKKQNPQPDKSIKKEREPKHQPNTYPARGQHQPDIQDERSKSKRGNKPVQRDWNVSRRNTGQ